MGELKVEDLTKELSSAHRAQLDVDEKTIYESLSVNQLMKLQVSEEMQRIRQRMSEEILRIMKEHNKPKRSKSSISKVSQRLSKLNQLTEKDLNQFIGKDLKKRFTKAKPETTDNVLKDVSNVNKARNQKKSSHVSR